MGTCPTVTVPAPARWDFWASLPVSHCPSRPQPMSCLQTLGLAVAVSKALSMGGGFRWGCGRTKAASGVVSVEPQQE